jgi:hypothetical protein
MSPQALFHLLFNQFDDRLAQLSEYSPIAQEVTGSIPAQMFALSVTLLDGNSTQCGKFDRDP